MNSLIDRYIYDFSRCLPLNIRADAERELRSRIEDMLPENSTENDIKNILLELGRPSKLALKYNPNPRYLISPESYDEYVKILKTAAIVMASFMSVLGLFKNMPDPFQNTSVLKSILLAFSGGLSGAFTGLVFAFFWVTALFFIIERFDLKKEINWTLKDLPEIPHPAHLSVLRGKVLAGSLFNVFLFILFFTGVFHNPPLIAWYKSGGFYAPVFNEQILLHYLPFFITLLFLSVILAGLKIYYGKWNFIICIFSIIYHIANACVMISYIKTRNIFQKEFINLFADSIRVSTSVFYDYMFKGFAVLTIIIIISAIAEIIKSALRTYKSLN